MHRPAVALIILLMTITAPGARAAIIWSWSFEPVSATVGPTDVVNLYARLWNDSTAGETVTGIGGYGFSWDPTVDVEYGWTWDVTGSFPLLPGNSTLFLFGHFTPLGPDFSVAPGPYSTSAGALAPNFDWVQQPSQAGLNPFSLTVQAETAIPEPGSFLLCVPALVGLVAIARRRRPSA